MSFPQVLTGVAHIGIPTNDLDKTIAFYKKLGLISSFRKTLPQKNQEYYKQKFYP